MIFTWYWGSYIETVEFYHAKPGYIRFEVLKNSVDPDQLASQKPADQGIHYLPFCLEICEKESYKLTG